jgi:hypothetical protein
MIFNTSIIIGNGFDLNLGRKTSYSDFAKSEEWNDLLDIRGFHFNSGDADGESLLQAIDHASKESQWFDIENEIYKWAKAQEVVTPECVIYAKEDFRRLKEALNAYLVRVEQESIDESSMAGELLFHFYTLKNNPGVLDVFSFNYTHLRYMDQGIFDQRYKILTYVHGSIDDNLVLGCENYEKAKIKRELSFLYKYNMLKKANHIAQKLVTSNNVLFFGHSINEMDFCYFRDYFKRAASNEGVNMNLAFVCKDEDSAMAIRDNIESQGIVVQDLYNHLNRINFIRMDEMNNPTEKDYEYWHEFLNSLKA